MQLPKAEQQKFSANPSAAFTAGCRQGATPDTSVKSDTRLTPRASLIHSVHTHREFLCSQFHRFTRSHPPGSCSSFSCPRSHIPAVRFLFSSSSSDLSLHQQPPSSPSPTPYFCFQSHLPIIPLKLVPVFCLAFARERLIPLQEKLPPKSEFCLG